MAPHVSRLRREDLYSYLLEHLSPVINTIVEEMQRNNSLNRQQIDTIGRQPDSADRTRMLVAYLETEPQPTYDGFLQAVTTLQYHDILARMNDDNTH